MQPGRGGCEPDRRLPWGHEAHHDTGPHDQCTVAPDPREVLPAKAPGLHIPGIRTHDT